MTTRAGPVQAGRQAAHKRQNMRAAASGPYAGRVRAARRAARRNRRAALWSLAVLLLAECFAALLYSPAARVRRVALAGWHGLTPPEIQAVQAEASGVLGANWLRAPLGRLQQRLQAAPALRFAWVGRQFPNGVLVRLTVRRPAYDLLCGDRCLELSASGIVIRAAARNPALPCIEWNDESQPAPGAALTHGVVSALKQILQSGTAQHALRIAKIEIDHSRDMCLNMKDGLDVRLGQPDQIANKLALVQRIYARQPDVASSLARLDVSCPSAPACTPRVSAPSSSASTVSRQLSSTGQ